MIYDWVIQTRAFLKHLSQTEQKTSRAHVHSLGRDIPLLSLKPKQLKPVKTEYVSFCSCLLFQNPQIHWFVCVCVCRFSLSISNEKLGTSLPWKMCVLLLFMATLWQWLNIPFVFLFKRNDLSQQLTILLSFYMTCAQCKCVMFCSLQIQSDSHPRCSLNTHLENSSNSGLVLDFKSCSPNKGFGKDTKQIHQLS